MKQEVGEQNDDDDRHVGEGEGAGDDTTGGSTGTGTADGVKGRGRGRPRGRGSASAAVLPGDDDDDATPVFTSKNAPPVFTSKNKAHTQITRSDSSRAPVGSTTLDAPRSRSRSVSLSPELPSKRPANRRAPGGPTNAVLEKMKKDLGEVELLNQSLDQSLGGKDNDEVVPIYPLPAYFPLKVHYVAGDRELEFAGEPGMKFADICKQVEAAIEVRDGFEVVLRLYGEVIDTSRRINAVVRQEVDAEKIQASVEAMGMSDDEDDDTVTLSVPGDSKSAEDYAYVIVIRTPEEQIGRYKMKQVRCLCGAYPCVACLASVARMSLPSPNAIMFETGAWCHSFASVAVLLCSQSSIAALSLCCLTTYSAVHESYCVCRGKHFKHSLTMPSKSWGQPRPKLHLNSTATPCNVRAASLPDCCPSAIRPRL